MAAPISRRTVLKSAGASGIGLGVVGAAAAQPSVFRRQLRDIRRATRKYRDPSVAIADGFQVGEYGCGGGLHYDHLNRRESPTTDLLNPEVILYGVNGRGDHVLAGVEYEVHGPDPATTPSPDPPDLFADEGENLKVTEAEAWRLVGPVIQDGVDLGHIWALHVWVHMGNPDGLFAACNPTALFRRPGCIPNDLCGGPI